MLRKLVRRILREDKFKQLEKQLDLHEPEFLTPGDDQPDDEEEQEKERDPNVDFYLPKAESRIRRLVRMLLEITCPDCKGTGQYVGFMSRGKCKTCGGTGELPTPPEAQLDEPEEGVATDLRIEDRGGGEFWVASVKTGTLVGPWPTKEKANRRIKVIDEIVGLIIYDGSQQTSISDRWLEKNISYNFQEIEGRYGNPVAVDISQDRVVDYIKFRVIKALRKQGVPLI